MEIDTLLDALQWPAMMATLIAAWLVGAQTKRERSWGFYWFIFSNVLWAVWGWHAQAYALILLQVGLFAVNLRGRKKNQPAESPGS